MITGINHITLAVSDLSRSVRFYRDFLGCELVSVHSGGAYFRAGSLWLCLATDSTAVDQDRSDYTHLAFDIAESQFDEFAASVAAANVPVWKENQSEGPSVYFLDPDGHKLEVHVGSLTSRLDAMATPADPAATGACCAR